MLKQPLSDISYLVNNLNNKKGVSLEHNYMLWFEHN